MVRTFRRIFDGKGVCEQIRKQMLTIRKGRREGGKEEDGEGDRSVCPEELRRRNIGVPKKCVKEVRRRMYSGIVFLEEPGGLILVVS